VTRPNQLMGILILVTGDTAIAQASGDIGETHNDPRTFPAIILVELHD